MTQLCKKPGFSVLQHHEFLLCCFPHYTGI